MATSAQASKAVVVAGMTMTGLTLAQAARSPGSFNAGGLYKRLWGIAALTLALGIAADFAPEMVVPFSVLIVLAFVVKNQGAFGAIIRGEGKAQPASAPQQPASTGQGGGTGSKGGKGGGGGGGGFG